jgi:hypothetical protein
VKKTCDLTRERKFAVFNLLYTCTALELLETERHICDLYKVNYYNITLYIGVQSVLGDTFRSGWQKRRNHQHTIRDNYLKAVNKNNTNNKIDRCFVFYGVINFGSLFHSAFGVSK